MLNRNVAIRELQSQLLPSSKSGEFAPTCAVCVRQQEDCCGHNKLPMRSRSIANPNVILTHGGNGSLDEGFELMAERVAFARALIEHRTRVIQK